MPSEKRGNLRETLAKKERTEEEEEDEKEAQKQNANVRTNRVTGYKAWLRPCLGEEERHVGSGVNTNAVAFPL
ncbi:hypothetical protein RUM43_003598 [Polyplax serrata]|uniref:Uncharacterized protein n=1 Tax=Polyplax serrata TaxID=468196 RepID=A0AAN8S3A2_POLSC